MKEPTKRQQPQIPRRCNQRQFEIRNVNVKEGGAPRRQTRRAQASPERKLDRILALVSHVLWIAAAIALLVTVVALWAWAIPTVEGALADVQRLEVAYAQR